MRLEELMDKYDMEFSDDERETFNENEKCSADEDMTLHMGPKNRPTRRY